MKVLVCGSRDWHNLSAIERRIAQLPDDTLVIEGGAWGADRMARFAAQQRGLFVAEVRCDDPHWKRYGKRAGHMRNAAMLDLQPDIVIAFSNGSPGTNGTMTDARRRGIPVEVHTA